MDREKADKVDGQVGFIQHIALPVFVELSRLLPLGDLVSNVASNLEFYKVIKVIIDASSIQSF